MFRRLVESRDGLSGFIGHVPFDFQTLSSYCPILLLELLAQKLKPQRENNF